MPQWFTYDARCAALLQRLDMRNDADLRTARSQGLERLHRNLERVGIETSEAFVEPTKRRDALNRASPSERASETKNVSPPERAERWSRRLHAHRALQPLYRLKKSAPIDSLEMPPAILASSEKVRAASGNRDVSAMLTVHGHAKPSADEARVALYSNSSHTEV